MSPGRRTLIRAAQAEALMQASLALTTELSLERVLQKIAEVARDVLQARYAALSVLDENGPGLSQFLTAGIDDETKAAIGTPPAGRGVLGLLISAQRPIRIKQVSSHPRSVGFPAHHPPMQSFLGVPIMVRDRASGTRKAYGNLYATEKQGAKEFSAADEEIAVMLAAQAGIAIENARAFRALEETHEGAVRKEKLAALGQVAGSVAHELRNPLAVINNSVYYLRMVLPVDDARARKHLGILEREVDTANRIVTGLLDFARIKSPMRVPTDLTVLTRELLDRLPLPDHVNVIADLAASIPPVEVDRLQVGQILTNVISNAVQAMPDGGTLTITTRSDAAEASVTVSDTGMGMSADDLPRIFQPLFTTKAKGIGLGLALAKDLAEANRATISVESAPGAGSRFILRVPLTRPG